MVKNGYLSRNVKDVTLFERVLNDRLEAKRRGDKKTADAFKLIANTAFGCSNNKYNEMYDPLMSHSICISGQLYLIELIVMLGNALESFYLIQANTDGIMFSIAKRHIRRVRNIILEWEKITGFEMEETGIDAVIQRDVNSYVMRDLKGKIKAKGGTVSDFDGGDFVHNSLVVVCRAIVNNLLDGVPVAETIEACDNIFDFQMIVKSGHTYKKVIHETADGEVEINKVNRIYAAKDENLGPVYKVKENGRRDRVPDCPPHAIIDNKGTLTLDKIDKMWYIELANKRLLKFKGDKK